MSCSLDVELDAPGDAVVIIRDTDVGMTLEELTAAVQPVAQNHIDRQQQCRDTGVGLSLVKAIVEAHGGVLIVESVPKNGTAVSFTLPYGGMTGRAVVKPYTAYICAEPGCRKLKLLYALAGSGCARSATKSSLADDFQVQSV